MALFFLKVRKDIFSNQTLVWDHTWKGSGRVSVVHWRRNDCVSIDRTICKTITVSKLACFINVYQYLLFQLLYSLLIFSTTFLIFTNCFNYLNVKIKFLVKKNIILNFGDRLIWVWFEKRSSNDNDCLQAMLLSHSTSSSRLDNTQHDAKRSSLPRQDLIL